MLSKVKRLRERGQRLTDRQIDNTVPAEGELRVHILGYSIVATLLRKGYQVENDLLPPLHDMRLVMMHGNGMLLRGEERPQGEKGPAVVQEWSVRFDVRQP